MRGGNYTRVDRVKLPFLSANELPKDSSAQQGRVQADVYIFGPCSPHGDYMATEMAEKNIGAFCRDCLFRATVQQEDASVHH